MLKSEKKETTTKLKLGNWNNICFFCSCWVSKKKGCCSLSFIQHHRSRESSGHAAWMWEKKRKERGKDIKESPPSQWPLKKVPPFTLFTSLLLPLPKGLSWLLSPLLTLEREISFSFTPPLASATWHHVRAPPFPKPCFKNNKSGFFVHYFLNFVLKTYLVK